MGILYQVSKINTKSRESLIDRGANGALVDNDVRVICKHDPPRYIDFSGLNNHQVKDLEIVTAGGVAPPQCGPAIVILHQYALLGTGSTIYSCIQLESYKSIVNDKTIYHKGSQTITTIDGYIHLLDFIHGLPYIPLRPYTDEDWITLPHVIWTSDKNWNPTSIDHKVIDNDERGDNQTDQPENNSERLFNEIGDYIISLQFNPHPILDINKTDMILKRHHNTSKLEGKVKPPDYNVLRPYLLYVDNNTIRYTIDATTQYGRAISRATQLKSTFRSPFQALNIFRRNEAVASDTVYLSVPAIDDGSRLAQICFGRRTLLINIYSIKT